MRKQKAINPSQGGVWGIMGGTYNPVHFGHLIMAESIMRSLKARGMLFVPARTHPLKTETQIESSYNDRMAMLDLALEDNEHFIITEPPETSGYTIDLIDCLQSKYPHARFFLPIGSDLIEEFHKWHKHEEIEERVEIVIASRPGHQLACRLDGVLKGAEHIVIPQYDIASRVIRQRVLSRMSIRYMVPEPVRKYIVNRGLYAQ